MKKFAIRVLFVLLFLLTVNYQLFTSAAEAAGPPDPQPCKNPESKPDELVHNYILNKDGKPPIVIGGYDDITGTEGQVKDLPARNFSYNVDFSKLQSLFGATNSNYIESDVQNLNRRHANIIDLKSPDFNGLNGPIQKAQAKVVIDEQKVNYVTYVYNKPTLAESGNTYTDIKNQGNPKTIYDLVTEYGLPVPPQADATEEEKELWLETWGKYWPKIPTSYSEFYKGEIFFHVVRGDKELERLKYTEDECPRPIVPTINFVMPEFYRTTATSDPINRQIVPFAAQSYRFHEILNNTPGASASTDKTNFLQEFFAYCWKLLSNPTKTAQEIRKAVSQTIQNMIVADALALEKVDACFKQLDDGKKGRSPYCPLPLTEIARLGSAVSCANKNDSLKLEKDNPNVVCTFTFSTGPTTYEINSLDSACRNNGDGTFTCTPKIYIVPNFRIPWLAAIWNNTIYSDENEGLLNNQEQETGRPGIYTFFTPQSVYQILFPGPKENARELVLKCFPDYPNNTTPGDQNACQAIGYGIPCTFDQSLEDFVECVSGKIDKKLPGEIYDSEDKKERFIGATDCNKIYVRDIALKPKALQEHLGIKNECKLDL